MRVCVCCVYIYIYIYIYIYFIVKLSNLIQNQRINNLADLQIRKELIALKFT